MATKDSSRTEDQSGCVASDPKREGYGNVHNAHRSQLCNLLQATRKEKGMATGKESGREKKE